MDHKGDDSKKPPECKGEHTTQCPHMKCTYEGWEDSSYGCDICGARYKLYEEDMK